MTSSPNLSRMTSKDSSTAEAAARLMCLLELVESKLGEIRAYAAALDDTEEDGDY
jgi:hypothetical protein